MVRVQSLQGAQEKAEHAFEYRILLADGTVTHVRTLRRPVLVLVSERGSLVTPTADVFNATGELLDGTEPFSPQ
jgi:hypothetical protein